MKELVMRRNVVKALAPLHAIPVENGYTRPGTPDVNFHGGWLECKWMDRWPAVPADRPIKLKHDFTPEQRLFAIQRARVGGHVWLLLQVGREWLLFHGTDAARLIGRATREELYQGACAVWRKGLNIEELIKCVSLAS